jgi:NADH-quinone oxidoreductase subunit N
VKTLTYTSFLAIFCLIAELFNLRKLLVPILVIGLVIIGGITFLEMNNAPQLFFHEMVGVDKFSSSFSLVLLTITALIVVLGGKVYKNEPAKISDYLAIILFALCGALAMVSFANMAMLFIGIEIMSISFYILAGTNKRDVKSNEAAMKYFLMGAFTSGILLMGITLIYGASASFNLVDIAAYAQGSNVDAIFNIGIVLVLISLLFKVAAVPFHFWTPDVYEGAPAVITAFMSTLGKVASFAAFYRLFSSCFGSQMSLFIWVLEAIIGLTIIVGTFSALKQDSLKRILAFSGVTNAGYMLLAIGGIGAVNAGSLFYFSLSYAFSSIAAFVVIIYIVENKQSDKIEAFKGLAHKQPLMAAILTGAMLSLAGIPPFAGFLAKYYLFSQAISNGFIALTLLAILSSMIGVYYYLKVVFSMFASADGQEYPSPSLTYISVGIVSIMLVLLAGVLPSFFMLL